MNRGTTAFKRTALASVFAASTLGLAACNDTAGSEAGADVEDITEENPEAEVDPAADDEIVDDEDYTPFADFGEDVQSYVGETVTVSADVNEVISDMAFTIAGTENTMIDPLLIISAESNADVEEDAAVAVTGTVHEAFVITDVEDEFGIDLDDELFAEWEQQHYITATNISFDVAEPEEDDVDVDADVDVDLGNEDADEDAA